MAPFPGFIGGSNQTQALSLDVEQTMNLYVERAQAQAAKGRAALMSIPGFQPWTAASTVSDVGGRAQLVASDRFFALMGGGFYEFDVNGTPTKWGTIAQNANPGQMAYNGVVGGQLLINSGGNAYTFVLATNTFAAVAALAGKVTHIGYSDGYFVAFDVATGKNYLSSLNDGTTWDTGGTFFRRSKFADPQRAMFVDGNGLVWVIGSESFEVWEDTGTGTQPFAPLSGLLGRNGIASSFGFGLAGAVPYWLSQTTEGAGLVVRATGSGVETVSTYAVSNAISMYARTHGITNAEMLIYQDQGHTFLNLTFPNDGTWSMDIEGQNWAQRGRFDSRTGTYGVWSPRAHAYAFGKHLITERTTGVVYVMDQTLATEIDGAGIRRLRRTPAFNQEYRRLPYDKLLLLADVGVGLVSGQGSDPQVMLRCSDDGGVTFGNERIAGMGRLGQYRRMIYWTRLGVSADMAFEVVVSDPVPVRFVNAFINPDSREMAQAA